MALSSVAVVANSLRLRRIDVRPDSVRLDTSRRLVGRLREAWFLGAIAVASLGVAGAVLAVDRGIEDGAARVEVVASATRFDPDQIHVPAGQFVVLTLRNDDPIFHDLEVEGLANVDIAARPGQTARLRVRIDQPGAYRFLCTVEGHAAAGMTGTLVVD